MRDREEGKLLARGEGFITLGEWADRQVPAFFAGGPFVVAKRLPARPLALAIPLHSHQGEREKNEYL
jgi:hypothetical protein